MRLVGSTGRVGWRRSRTASHGPLQPASWPHWWPQVSGRLSSLYPFKITFHRLFVLGRITLHSLHDKNWNQVETVLWWEVPYEGSIIKWLISPFNSFIIARSSESSLNFYFAWFAFFHLSWQLPITSTNYLPCPSVIHGLLWRVAGLHRDLKWQMISLNE